jgi:hypothetical protein
MEVDVDADAIGIDLRLFVFSHLKAAGVSICKEFPHLQFQ